MTRGFLIPKQSFCACFSAAGKELEGIRQGTRIRAFLTCAALTSGAALPQELRM
jgi:hypothetical protein